MSTHKGNITTTVQGIIFCVASSLYATRHTDRETIISQGIDTLILNDLNSQSELYYNSSRNYSLRYERKHTSVNKYFKICNVNKHYIYLMKSAHHITKRNTLHQFKTTY